MLALTATADEKVTADIGTYLQLVSPVVHRQSVDRPNISYAMYQVDVNLRKRTGLKNDFALRQVQESFMSLHANGRMNWHSYCRKVRLPPPPTMREGAGRPRIYPGTIHLLGNLIGFVRRMLLEWVYIRMTSVK